MDGLLPEQDLIKLTENEDSCFAFSVAVDIWKSLRATTGKNRLLKI